MGIQNRPAVIYFPIILAIFFVAGIFVGKTLKHDEIIQQQKDKLSDVFELITEKYVDSVSYEELIDRTIPKILETLDPHTIYIPAEELAEINESLEGNFDGIGIQFNIQNDTVVVVNTIPGGPSADKGVMAGDRIVKVDGKVIAGVKISNNNVMKLLKGRKGTKVIIGVKRKNVNEILDYEITRDEIPLWSIDVAYMIDKITGYIKISKFSRTTYEEFIEKFDGLKKQGLKKLIIDLRDNGGGYMDAATDLADEFLDYGKLIVYTQGAHQLKNEVFSTTANKGKDIEVAVLLNEFSASASEIFAGALQDNDRAIIVGRRSFGKGLVQEQIPLTDGSAIRLTVARYYTPVGRSVQKPYSEGVDDYYSDLEKRYYNGEFDAPDSTKFADSLKFITPGGKVVYGGGGIMPDVFVGVDSLGVSDYFFDINDRSLVYR